MRVLFVNTNPAQCGVHQYGENLYAVLQKSGLFESYYGWYDSEEQLRATCSCIKPDFIIYNWQQLIGGWMGGAPFSGLGKQVLVFHDMNARFDDFDAILFSDPAMPQHGKWFPIGRPLNYVNLKAPIKYGRTAIGVNGLVGAWCTQAVGQILSQFGTCHIRLHLPYSTFCDPHGQIATSLGYECLKMAAANGTTVEVSHEYLKWEDLIYWLYCNDLNCYIRDLVPWRGVSSILDAALCAKRPIAINRCSAFRHMHDCSPSICVEDRSLTQILDSGCDPLKQKLLEYRPMRVATQVKRVLESI